MRTLSGAVAAIAMAIGSIVSAQAPPAGGDVGIAVTYKGKGPVNATHEILVFTFSEPAVGPNSIPLGRVAVTKNGDAAWFRNVTTTPVYIVAVYDEKDTYDGQSGPPPQGTPWALYRDAKGAPAAVKPGAKTPLTMTFDDSNRWPPPSAK